MRHSYEKGGRASTQPSMPVVKGKGKKKKTKEPQIVRYYFEDEPYEYEKGGMSYMDYKASGGAIYKGDRVKIRDTNESMVVKNIEKGKKGYVEFSGDKGTFLKGDLEKYGNGGMTSYGLVSNDVFIVTEDNHQLTGDMFTYIGTDNKGRIKAKSYPAAGKKPVIISGLDSSGVRKITKEEATKLAKRKVLGNIANRMSGLNYKAKGGMTEHGLKLGDKIVHDFDNDLDKKRGRGRPEVAVTDEKGEMNYVNLDEGKRYEKGGYMKKGGKTIDKKHSRAVDKGKKAKKAGWRKSKETGEWYKETRSNRSDKDPKKRLEKGGNTSGYCYSIGGL